MASEYEPVESPDSTTVFPYHDLTPPTIADVFRAKPIVDQYLPRTPLVRSEPLSAEFDAEIYLKREDTFPIGAFKVRGGVNLVHNLDEEFRDRGLITASTGNHGQSIAFAGREFDVPVIVGVPEDANPSKVAAMERLGARVEKHGDDFDEAREWVEQQAIEKGYRYVHSANEPRLISGVGTAGIEVVEDLPDIDILYTPVGGGSSASGYCLTVGELTDAKVIGIQSESADAMYRAWSEGHLEPQDRMETFAEGIATRVPFALTAEILQERLDDLRLVNDEELKEGIRWMLDNEHLIFEGACATSVAELFRRRDEIEGKKIVFPVSGRNIQTDRLLDIVTG
ncbi:MAG: threonine/serine dehydratase [Halobacteriales archaeon]